MTRPFASLDVVEFASLDEKSISTVFAGQTLGITEVEDHIWMVSFLDYDLGFFDAGSGRVEPAENPFGPDKVLTMSPV